MLISLSPYSDVPHNYSITSIELVASIKHAGIAEFYDDLVNVTVLYGNAIVGSELLVHAVGAGRTEISFNYSNEDYDLRASIDK